ncbi:hypothetical protein GCM10008938_52160 [Deinococcus roseus]|uniref:Intein C-terminal splicing domain-containing protein n=2 Tax=Deinococcus roseus TaxID=392414 RepID=A0ABQ2DKT1_9DEIO|nr:hypothetical protein GCM10008938_52160 [Deinococcus roseus]
MYNLEVEEAHTFFVGTQGWLVHNGNGPVYGPYQLTGKALNTLPKPPHMGMVELGKLIGWGGKVTTGFDDAIRRIETLTDADIKAIYDAGIGSDYSRTLANGYRNAPQPNKTAPGRAILMDEVAKRLEVLEKADGIGCP